MKLSRSISRYPKQRDFSQERANLEQNYQEYLGEVAVSFTEQQAAAAYMSTSEKKELLFQQRDALVSIEQDHQQRVQQLNEEWAEHLADENGVPLVAAQEYVGWNEQSTYGTVSQQPSCGEERSADYTGME